MRSIVRHQTRQRGASMIEVLIALFVLSVGLLAVAGMQQIGLRNSHSAHLRSQATALAYDIADRMRANVVRARAQEYDVEMDDDFPDLDTCPAANPAEQVQCDLAEWGDALDRVLPRGDGSVDIGAVDPATGVQTAVVIVRWDDSRNADDPLEFRTDTQL